MQCARSENRIFISSYLKRHFLLGSSFLEGFHINYKCVQRKFSNLIKAFKILIMKTGRKGTFVDRRIFGFPFTGIYKHLE